MDFNRVLITTLIAGLICGGIQGTIHYWVRPYRYHPTLYYAMGSFWCLVAFSAVVYYLDGSMWAIASAWGIWAITGAWVALAYMWDALSRKRRRAEVSRAVTKDDSDTTGGF